MSFWIESPVTFSPVNNRSGWFATPFEDAFAGATIEMKDTNILLCPRPRRVLDLRSAQTLLDSNWDDLEYELASSATSASNSPIKSPISYNNYTSSITSHSPPTSPKGDSLAHRELLLRVLAECLQRVQAIDMLDPPSSTYQHYTMPITHPTSPFPQLLSPDLVPCTLHKPELEVTPLDVLETLLDSNLSSILGLYNLNDQVHDDTLDFFESFAYEPQMALEAAEILGQSQVGFRYGWIPTAWTPGRDEGLPSPSFDYEYGKCWI